MKMVYRESYTFPNKNYGGRRRRGGAAAWLNSDVAWMLWRLLMVYVVLMLCRVVFYLYNRSLIGDIAGGEFWQLFAGAIRFDTVSMLYANALFIILSLFPLKLRAKRWWRAVMFWYYIIANGLSVALNMADCVYFHYTQKRLTADEMFFAGNDNTVQLLGKFMLENWYLVLIAAALICLLVFAYRRRAVPRTPIHNPLLYYLVSLLMLAVAAGLTVGGIRGGINRSTRPITLSNATQYTSSSSKANLVLSNPFCVVRTIGNGKLSYIKYYSAQQAAEIYTPYHYPGAVSPDGAEFPVTDTIGITRGLLKGRNLMVFVMESFSAEHSAHLNPHLYQDGEGFTPFLDSLMRDGFTFTQAFANGHKSIEALPSVLGSIPSFKRPFVLLPQSLGESRQMPEILAGEGYQTAFFCGSPRSSMGFAAYGRSAGIEQFFGQEEYEKKRGRNDHDGYWGIWDEPMLDYVGEELSQMQQPFFGAAFTLSSHHPFVVPEKYADELPVGWTKIHQGVRYTDNAIRLFFEKYSSEEWFANTVFVFAADHVSSETFAPETRTTLGSSHIIQFIYTPDRAFVQQYQYTTQQADLMPTLLGLMGYGKPYFAYGRDILNEPERPAVTFGFTTRGMSFYIADDNYLVLFDEHAPTAVYLRSDTLEHNPLPKPYPAKAEELLAYLKAVIQQYYQHLEAKSYVAPER